MVTSETTDQQLYARAEHLESIGWSVGELFELHQLNNEDVLAILGVLVGETLREWPDTEDALELMTAVVRNQRYDIRDHIRALSPDQQEAVRVVFVAFREEVNDLLRRMVN